MRERLFINRRETKSTCFPPIYVPIREIHSMIRWLGEMDDPCSARGCEPLARHQMTAGIRDVHGLPQGHMTFCS
jgi:hypothetical protein